MSGIEYSEFREFSEIAEREDSDALKQKYHNHIDELNKISTNEICFSKNQWKYEEQAPYGCGDSSYNKFFWKQGFLISLHNQPQHTHTSAHTASHHIAPHHAARTTTTSPQPSPNAASKRNSCTLARNKKKCLGSALLAFRQFLFGVCKLFLLGKFRPRHVRPLLVNLWRTTFKISQFVRLSKSTFSIIPGIWLRASAAATLWTIRTEDVPWQRQCCNVALGLGRLA